jgi:hypothetical protein
MAPAVEREPQIRDMPEEQVTTHLVRAAEAEEPVRLAKMGSLEATERMVERGYRQQLRVRPLEGLEAGVGHLIVRLGLLGKEQTVEEMDFSNQLQMLKMELQTRAEAVEEGVRQTHTQMVGQAARVLSSSNTPTTLLFPTQAVA